MRSLFLKNKEKRTRNKSTDLRRLRNGKPKVSLACSNKTPSTKFDRHDRFVAGFDLIILEERYYPYLNLQQSEPHSCNNYETWMREYQFDYDKATYYLSIFNKQLIEKCGTFVRIADVRVAYCNHVLHICFCINLSVWLSKFANYSLKKW